jgi:hypothetical protein
MSAPDPQRLRDELRHAAEGSAGASIDLPAVLDGSRRARRRRRTAIAGGTTAVAALLVAAALTGGLSAIAPPASTTADAPAVAPADAGREAAVAPRDGGEAGDVALGELDLLYRCGAAVPMTADAAASPLHVDVAVADDLSSGGSTMAVVTLTNTGAMPVVGTVVQTPSVAVVEDDAVVWLSNDAVTDPATQAVELGPGQSAELMAPVEARVCTSPGGRLPDALVPGEYGLSATVVFTADGAGETTLLVSPVVPLAVG